MNDRFHFRVRVWIFLFLFLKSFFSFSQITLPAIIGDSMVLQQNARVPLWGNAPAGSTIKVHTSWDQNEMNTLADPQGNWKVNLNTPVAGGPYDISINERTLTGVMTGEVWLCSGQSNMQWSLRQSDNADQEIATARYPVIRFFYVAREAAAGPKKNCTGHWESCYPGSAETFSAVAYFFGRELYQELGVPIGLIHSSWGGTPAEAWTRKEILETNPDLNIYLKNFEAKVKNSDPGINPVDNQSPSALYNAMIAPLIPFTIKGVIWYQGEANRNEASLYEKLLPAMIDNWRQDWGNGDFPFYYVQIAPFDYDEPMAGALLRDAQRKTLNVPNTGMVVTLDIGNPDDIHPANKQDVGKRLALWALAKDYNKPDLEYSGPVYRSMIPEGTQIRIDFDHVGKGLVLEKTKTAEFEIAGKDQIFKPAGCQVSGNSLLVSSPEVTNPLAVRYAFRNTSQACLFNREGLPASTFRTDDWPILTAGVRIEVSYDSLAGDFIINLHHTLQEYDIRYTTDGSDPGEGSKIFTGPFIPDGGNVIKARAFDGSVASVQIAEKKFEKHLVSAKKTDLKFPYNLKYTAGGKYGLVDGIRGSTDFRDGSWQGFEGKDLDMIIDLGTKTELHEISAGFLQIVNSWIFFPEYVEFSFSANRKRFSSVVMVRPDSPITQKGELLKDFSVQLKHTKARYIRIFAKNIAVCPDWHPGAGEKAWIFVDEIVVK